MSKFRFESEGSWLVRYDGDRLVEKFTPAALQEFTTAAQAALAEQNSGVIQIPGGCCNGISKQDKACAEYMCDCVCCVPPVCERCGHPRACHKPREEG